MKKAKLMLSALSIIAILATAFAFKTVKFENHFIYTGDLGSGSCTNKLEGAAIVTGVPAVKAAWVTPRTTDCPDVKIISVTD